MKKCPCCEAASEDEASQCGSCGAAFWGGLPVDPQLEDPENNLITLAAFSDLVQPSLLIARLEAAGIAACIPEEFEPALFGHSTLVTRTTVRVAAKDVAAARAILDEFFAQPGVRENGEERPALPSGPSGLASLASRVEQQPMLAGKTGAQSGQEQADAAAVGGAGGSVGLTGAAPAAVASPDRPGQRTEAHGRGIGHDAPRLFRALVLIATVADLVWFLELLVAEPWISPELWDAFSWQSYGAVLLFPQSVGWLFMLVSVAVAVGLYAFSRSARTVYGFLLVFGVTAALLGGVQVCTAFGCWMSTLGTMADGAILLMAYTAPLKGRFR